MHPSISDIREKIKRADKHIEDFKSGLADYMGTTPYAIRVDLESESGKPVIHVLKANPVPPILLAIIGDAIHNLRSALDYLACGLIRANHAEPGPKSEFPILDGPITTKRHETRFLTKVEGMREEVIQAIRDIRPYQGGDNELWRLHRLDAIDKHNMLVAALGNITAINGFPPIVDQWNGNRWDGIPGVPLTLKQGDQFSIEAPYIKVNKNTGFFAEVVFNQPNVAEGYPVVLALRQFRRRVFMLIGKLSWALK